MNERTRQQKKVKLRLSETQIGLGREGERDIDIEQASRSFYLSLLASHYCTAGLSYMMVCSAELRRSFRVAEWRKKRVETADRREEILVMSMNFTKASKKKKSLKLFITRSVKFID
jgi:hypothetical protein